MNRLIFLAALGYFIDIVDIFLFSVLRVPSLKALGVPDTELLSSGVFILNWQMGGLLLGGVIWGVLGDRKGRVRVLYGSILLYSLATLANAFVTSVNTYALCRFIAGIGLAGELGAAITLVSESLSREGRGWGTTLVAGFGLFGGVAAALLAQTFEWRTCYLIGGTAGLLLLLLRLKLRESSLYLDIAAEKSRGSLWLLLRSPVRVGHYLAIILVGVPIYFVSGILMVFAPEFAKALGVVGDPVVASKSVLYSYLGVALGDFLCGILSQRLKNRKKAIAIFLALVAAGIFAYLRAQNVSTPAFYVICFLVGIATGYWAVLLTMAAERFGTNLRATVSTTVPNFIRASVVLLSLGFKGLLPVMPMLEAAGIVAVVCVAVSAIALYFLPETYARDLKFLER